MAYEELEYADDDPTKPVSAARMRHMSAGIKAAAQTADQALPNTPEGMQAVAGSAELLATYEVPQTYPSSAPVVAALTCDLSDGSGDDQQPILQAILDSGIRGTVHLPAGIIPIDQPLVIPRGVGLIGAGAGKQDASYGTKFLLRDSSAKVSVSTLLSTDPHRGPMIGNFSIDGDDTAEVGLEVGYCAHRTFQPIDVTGTTQKAVYINGAQNCQWLGLKVSENGGDGVVFDHGASHHRVFGFEAAHTDGWALKFTQTAASPLHISPSVPSNNTIFGCLIEYAASGSPGFVLHEAGQNNEVAGSGGMFAGTASAAFDLVRMSRRDYGSGAVTSFDFRLSAGIVLQGNSTYVTGIALGSGTRMFAPDYPVFRSLLHAMRLDGGTIVASDGYTLNGVTNEFDPASTGTIANTISADKRSPVQVRRAAAGDDMLRFYIDGDTQARVKVTGNGRISFGSGSASQDVLLYRRAENVLGTGDDDAFRVGQVATGSRPSASTAGAGSMIFDTTLGKPIWSNGSSWTDATGATV